MRIRTAIFGAYVAASAVGLAVLMRFMLAEVRPRYVAAVEQNLQDSARLVAAALKNHTVAEARGALAVPHAFRVQLIGSGAQVLFDSSPLSTADEGHEDRSSGIVTRAGERLLDGDSAQAGLEVAATEPVQLHDDAAARLILSRSFRSVNEVVWAERRKLVAIALAIAAVMLLAGWWISTKLTDSLERLTAYAESVRDGRPVKPPTSRAAEIAALSSAFEGMRDALEGRHYVERYTQALAHEVKAPLAAIRGAAELLDEDMPRAQREKFLGNIRSEGARIQQLIDRLLELSSLEARKTLRQSETISVADLMQEAAQVVRPACANAQISLTVSPDATHTLSGERVLLREALVNLLQNALDFSPAGSAIGFAAATAEGRVCFTIEDQGPGVPAYALPRVFERFYSLPRPGTAKKSTGLGLALVREIAHLHGGESNLGNRAEGGARASLWVPANLR